MNSKRYVTRSTAIAARVLGDETMIMSAANSTLFTLDEVATVIWESADGMTPHANRIGSTRMNTRGCKCSVRYSRRHAAGISV